MAQFGPGATEISETRSFSTPQQGVVREPVAIQGATNIFDQLNQISENKREKKRVAFLGDFMTRQLAEVQAVDQGVRGSEAAGSRIRRNLATAINNYPSLADDLLSANNKILGKAGLGEVVTKGTEEEQQWERITNSLIDSGQIKPGASQNRIEEAYENLQLAKEAERRYNARIRTLNLESKEFANSELRKEAKAKAQKDRAIDTLPAKMDQFNNNLDKIVGGLQGNEFDQSTARQALDELWANFNQEVTPFMADMSETEASALKKPFKMKMEIAEKVITGEYDTEAAKAETERAKSTALAIALRDPKVLKSVMLSEIFPNAPLSKQIDDVNLILGGIFSDNLDPGSDQPANPFRNTPEGKEALNTYLNTIEDVEGMNDPDTRKKAEEEQATHLMKIFEGVEEYENTIAKDPKRAIDLVRWMAKPSFYDVRTKHKDQFQNTDTAMRVLQTHYGNEVVEMVDREFRKEGVLISSPDVAYPASEAAKQTETTSTDKLVRYEWMGDSIRFTPIEGGPSGPGIGEPAKEAARRLNEQLAPIINNQVRAAAHLEGNKNYETYFNKIEEQLLSGGQAFSDEEVEGSQGEDDLSMDDFKEDEKVEVNVSDVEVDNLGLTTNEYMKPIFDPRQGGSGMVREGAQARMKETLAGPFQKLQDAFGKPIVINDAIAKAGTSREKETPGSRHFHGDALDISLAGLSEEEKLRLYREAKKAGFTGFGFGTNILHIDRGPARGWNYGNKSFGGKNVYKLIKETYG